MIADMKDCIKILILTCGTNANYHIAKLLKEKYKGLFWIVGADINKRWQIPTSPYLDVFYQCPLTTDKDYYRFILEICKNNRIDYILPSFDADQQLFYEGNMDLAKISVKSLGITGQLKELYQSKAYMNAFLIKNGFPVPRFYSFSEIEKDKSYFVKPVNGVGSVGACAMKGEDIDEDTASCNVIEEICAEPEITLECFLYKGKIYSVARQRLAQKSGVCTKSKVYDDRELTEIVQRLADVLPLPFVFNLQFMRNGKGEQVITDVNLRAAGGMSLSYAAGWDEVSALANVMLQAPDEDVIKYVQPVEKEQYVMRAYTDIVTKTVEKKIAFDLDGTLLDSRARHQIVMDDVLKEFGIGLNTDDLVLFKAEGGNNIDWLIGKGINEDTALSVQKRWIELIESPQYLAKDKLYDGVKDLMSSLSKKNDLFLITARNNERNAREQIGRLGISQYFTKIIIVKSDKETSDAKAKYLVDNNIDLIVGDSETDFHAACIAKCECRMLNCGFRSEGFWSKMGMVSYSNLTHLSDL